MIMVCGGGLVDVQVKDVIFLFEIFIYFIHKYWSLNLKM